MKKIKLISMLIALLVVSIPIAIAQETGYLNQDISAEFAGEGGEYYVEDPSDACIDKSDESSSVADVLDNQVIGLLESIASIAFVITTTMNAIEQVVIIVNAITGVDVECCGLPPQLCKVKGTIYKAWEKFYSPFQTLSCFVSCGWCSGQGCTGLGKIPLEKFSLGVIPSVLPKTKPVRGVTPLGKGVGGISQFHISPFDNIYVAMGCLCPTAILFNLRKLKTIYQTYDCCIEQACAAGLSTDECEHFLSTATCMYWEGSIPKMLVNAVLSYISKLLANLIKESWLTPGTKLGDFLNCALLFFRLFQVPGLIAQVKGAFEWMSRSFSEPTCEDLGFESLEPTQDQIDEATADILEELADQPSYHRFQMPILSVDATLGVFITRPKAEVIDLIKAEIAAAELALEQPGDIHELTELQNKIDILNNMLSKPMEERDGGTFIRTETEEEEAYAKQNFPEEFKKVDAMVNKISKMPKLEQIALAGLIIEHAGAKAYKELQKAQKDEDLDKIIELINTAIEKSESKGDEKDKEKLEKIKKDYFDPLAKKKKDIEDKVAEKQAEEIKNKAKIYAMRIAMYEVIYGLLSETLGKFAYDFIDEKCEEDWDASDPESDDSIVSDTGTATGQRPSGVCAKVNDHSFTLQASRQETTYSYSFSVTNCKGNMNYQIIFKGDGERIVKQGVISPGVSASSSESFTDSAVYSEVCLSFTKGGANTEKCFPVA